jgi:hypothetical protein
MVTEEWFCSCRVSQQALGQQLSGGIPCTVAQQQQITGAAGAAFLAVGGCPGLCHRVQPAAVGTAAGGQLQLLQTQRLLELSMPCWNVACMHCMSAGTSNWSTVQEPCWATLAHGGHTGCRTAQAAAAANSSSSSSSTIWIGWAVQLVARRPLRVAQPWPYKAPQPWPYKPGSA